MVDAIQQTDLGWRSWIANRGVRLLLAALIVGGMPSCAIKQSVSKGPHTREHLEFTRAEKPKRLDQPEGTSDSIVVSSMESQRWNRPADRLGVEFAEGNTETLRDRAKGDTITIDVTRVSESSNRSEASLDEVLAESHSYGRSYAESSPSSDRNRRIEEVLRNSYQPFPSSDPADSSKGLVVGGIVILSLGFLILLLVSWVIGLIIMLLGGGLWIAGATKDKTGSTSSRSKQKNEEQPQWQDVVYLKNGSVIKGMIIEQVPNESIKIQTADGSVFVYEMAQVTKIAKEQKQ